MENEIVKLGIIENISIYFDINQSKEKFYVGRKGKEVLNKGYIFVPIETWNTIPVETFNNYPNESKSIEDYIDHVDFIIGGNDDLEFYKIVIEKIKNK